MDLTGLEAQLPARHRGTALHFRARATGAVFLLFAILAISACSALEIVSAISPSGHYVYSSDESYGPASRQVIDVYTPVEMKNDAPLVIFFYGNGWKIAARENYEFVASSLTRAGMMVMIPDYRGFPDVMFPEFVMDAAQAVAWATEQAREPGGQKSRQNIYLMGHSAGAHIAALLVTDDRYLDAAGVEKEAIAGFIGLSGAYDFLPIESGYLLDAFPAETRQRSQPIRFVDADTPTTLLIHGADDDVVEPGNSRRFAQRLESFGVSVRLLIYEGKGHAVVAAALAPTFEFIANTLDDTVDFIRSRESAKAAVDP